MPLQITLLSTRPKKWRLDVYPFVFVYTATAIFSYLYIEEEVITKLIFIFLALIHGLVYLLSHWSQLLKSKIQFVRIDPINKENIHKSSYVKLIYSKKDRSNIYEISELFMDDDENYFFYFHNKKYIFDEKTNSFDRLRPDTKKNLSDFLSEETLQSIMHKQTTFDENILEIPVRDQLIEPFSFFQFFSVSLWLMDENRFYALLTLGMLFLTSCTVVIQRLRSLITLRQMKLNPQYITVYKESEKKWVKKNSQHLKPGDLCLIQASSQIKPVETNQKDDEEILRKEIPFSDKLPRKFFQTEKMNVDSFKSLPCDILLLSGNCVVNEAILTGESIPQIKDAIEPFNEELSLKGKHKNSILFCGTDVLQTFPCDNEKVPKILKDRNAPNACIGYVLRTGYDTAKGKLIRTVLFNNENISVKHYDAFILIFILLALSIVASGLKDTTRDRNKLFLRCILIITTVVPPELPMILTIAVNSSIMYLQRKKIFCTEPFRIPLVGISNVCAFDKTGTLTEDDLAFKGIVEDVSNYQKLINFKDLSFNSVDVFAGCHSIVFADKKLLGDPIEKIFFENNEWDYSSVDKKAREKRGEKTVCIRKLFPFKSDLKRMSTISLVETRNQRKFKILCKGAPEIIENLLIEIPKQYKLAYEYYTKMGYRVLALAQRDLDDKEEFYNYQREDFSCLLICNSSLKSDTYNQINILKEASYQIIMITGDNLLTAISVGKQLELGSQIYLNLIHKNGSFVWEDIDGKEYFNMKENYTLCLCGDVFEQLTTDFTMKELTKIICNVIIFARTSPMQKELIITILKGEGLGVLMCGDGTNDVGALRKADVGIALVGLKEDGALLKKKKEKKNKMPEDPSQVFGELLGANDYKFGDACIAAPFTSKLGNSICCVPIILRQGISTMTTTIQTYKILSMSSIIAAYSLTALHLQALKFSELQSTVMGILAAANYYYFSNNKPLKTISNIRVSKSIFEPYFLTSVILQLALHLFAMDYAVKNIGIKYALPQDLEVKHDTEFTPTFLNTVIFLFSLVSQTCIFLFNHGGKPFSESLLENKRYMKWLLIPLVSCFFLANNWSDDLNYMFELKFEGVPQTANAELVALFLFVTTTNYLIERVIHYARFRKFHDYI